MTGNREPRAQRARLGSELRQLRRLAGLSGDQLGRRIGVSQRTVSRIEMGQAVPSGPQVTAWARAVKALPERRELLLALAAAAINEVTVYRDGLAGGLTGMQVSFRELEATARTIRNFQPGLIPGLLQTAEYARRVLEIADVTGAGDAAAAAAVRLERQQILHEPGRLFEFVMTEAALRWRPATAEVSRAQLLHLASLGSLESVALRVIPADAQMHAITRCGFIVYEDRADDQAPVVFIETPHAAVYASEAADVAIYRADLKRFRESALSGEDAATFVRELEARSLSARLADSTLALPAALSCAIGSEPLASTRPGWLSLGGNAMCVASARLPADLSHFGVRSRRQPRDSRRVVRCVRVRAQRWVDAVIGVPPRRSAAAWDGARQRRTRRRPRERRKPRSPAVAARYRDPVRRAIDFLSLRLGVALTAAQVPCSFGPGQGVWSPGSTLDRIV